jgi:hypothetical protein
VGVLFRVLEKQEIGEIIINVSVHAHTPNNLKKHIAVTGFTNSERLPTALSKAVKNCKWGSTMGDNAETDYYYQEYIIL